MFGRHIQAISSKLTDVSAEITSLATTPEVARMCWTPDEALLRFVGDRPFLGEPEWWKRIGSIDYQKDLLRDLFREGGADIRLLEEAEVTRSLNRQIVWIEDERSYLLDAENDHKQRCANKRAKFVEGWWDRESQAYQHDTQQAPRELLRSIFVDSDEYDRDHGKCAADQAGRNLVERYPGFIEENPDRGYTRRNIWARNTVARLLKKSGLYYAEAWLLYQRELDNPQTPWRQVWGIDG